MPRRNHGHGPQFEELWEASIGFYKVWILHTGSRYGIINSLASQKRGSSPAKLAAALSLSPRFVALWCDAAHSLGILRGRGGRYMLPRPLAKMLTDETDEGFAGGLPSYLALRSLDFGLMDRFAADGEASPNQRHLAEASREGTRFDHIAFTKLVLPSEPELERRLAEGASVLDIGCGEGGWTLRMASSFPSSNFTGVDPNGAAVRSGALRAKELGLSNVRFIEGTAAAVPAGSFDVAYLGEVLFLTGPRQSIVAGCHSAMREGGLVVVCEGLREERRGARRENQLVHAMQLDFALQGGSFFTRNELADLLRHAGFGEQRLHGAGGGLWFVVCRKWAPRRRQA